MTKLLILIVMMVKRKIEDEHRIFQNSWETVFCCISDKKPDVFSIICWKPYNFQNVIILIVTDQLLNILIIIIPL